MASTKPITSEELENLRECLRRCPEGTLDALVDFRATGSESSLNAFLLGVIRRHVEPEYEPLLETNRGELDFVEDLGIDSMTMMEIVMMVEECLDIRVENAELMQIRRFGELNAYVSGKLT